MKRLKIGWNNTDETVPSGLIICRCNENRPGLKNIKRLKLIDDVVRFAVLLIII